LKFSHRLGYHALPRTFGLEMQYMTEPPERISAFGHGQSPLSLHYSEIREETCCSSYVDSEASGMTGGITDGHETYL